MAQPNVLHATKLRVYISDGTSGDTRWKFLCTADSKTLEQAINFEEAFLPDCADPDAVPARTSRPTGERWDAKLDGKLDPTQTAWVALKDGFDAREQVEIKVTETVVGAESMTGFAWVESLTKAAAAGGFATFSCALRGEGRLTRTTIA